MSASLLELSNLVEGPLVPESITIASSELSHVFVDLIICVAALIASE